MSEHELDRRTSNGISWLLRGEAVGRAQSKECGEINQCLRIENTRRKFMQKTNCELEYKRLRLKA